MVTNWFVNAIFGRWMTFVTVKSYFKKSTDLTTGNQTKTHLCGLISKSCSINSPRSLFLLLLPQVARAVVEVTKQYVTVVSVEVVLWVVT